MSLSIKTLQARSRATHASYLPSAIDYCAPSFLALVHCAPKLHLVIASRKPALADPVLADIDALPIVSPTRKPSVASDLFALGVSASRAFGTYDSIHCAPMVGRNLSAQA
jgi:hypothetical protein